MIQLVISIDDKHSQLDHFIILWRHADFCSSMKQMIPHNRGFCLLLVPSYCTVHVKGFLSRGCMKISHTWRDSFGSWVIKIKLI